MKLFGTGLVAAAMLAAGAAPSLAATTATKIVRTEMVGPYKIVLNVLPPEPFFTRKEVKAKHIKAGMVIERGAKPVAMNGPMHPDHHLVVHVLRKKGGKAVTDARVTLTVVPLNAKGKPDGKAMGVPVVEMEMIGKGPQSTHYGNNVDLKPGLYRVVAHVGGRKALFRIKL